MAFSEKQKKEVWEKAKKVEGYDPATFRKDACGAWMVWDRYGDRDNLYGWEIDHVVPRILLKEKGIDDVRTDDLLNLRALQCRNNIGKGNDYPAYTACVTSDGNKNVERYFPLTVNARRRAKLNELYHLTDADEIGD